MTKKPDQLLDLLEKNIRDILADENLKPVDRLKALEVAAKLLMIRHKIEGGDSSGSFFASGG